MIFKRKVYNKLLEWKSLSAGTSAVLLEGARRIGKSTIVEEFAKNEYDDYMILDFAKENKDVRNNFIENMDNLDTFFRNLFLLKGRSLKGKNCVLIFDEVQLFPTARQAIKYLVADGRYEYIETGSLISIKKNVRDILIPSEEYKIKMYPMDFEEYLWATGDSITFETIKSAFTERKPLGDAIHRRIMKTFRTYMAVGGMPQAVEAYVTGSNFDVIDQIKRQIINLYEDDFKKLDSSGEISTIFHAIPAQLSKGIKRFRLASAIGRRRTSKTDKLIFDLIDSKTVLPSYNTTDPRVSLSLSKDLESYKLYLADTGLFITLMFIDRPSIENDIYAKLLSDKLPANLGYLYENLVAQMITASGRELYYHTWEKKNSTHYYEIDFLISDSSKVCPVEIKSTGTGKHESITEFGKKYSKHVKESFIISQKDVDKKEGITFLPLYLAPFLMEKK